MGDNPPPNFQNDTENYIISIPNDPGPGAEILDNTK